MTSQEIVSKLREEAKNNKIADAVFHMWASRQRARYQVTVAALDYRMKAEGFVFDRSEYVKLLKFLSSLGIGRLSSDFKGKNLALVDVKTTLQSIGIAAVQGGNLESFKRRNRYSKLIVEKPPSLAKNSDTKPVEITITVLVAGKPMQIQIPQNFTDTDIAGVISIFQGKKI